MNEKSKMILLGSVIVVIIGLAIWQLNSESSDLALPESDVISEQVDDIDADVVEGGEDLNNENDDEVEVESSFIDGEYSATGNYVSPAGQEEIFITLNLENDVITAVNFEGRAENPASIRLQQNFSDGLEEAVIGRSVEGLNLTVVNGSSLTPRGFNEALDRIKEEASRG